MVRLLMFLLGKSYETCKSCDTLREQLRIANEEKKEALEVILGFVKPKAVEAAPQELEAIRPKAVSFSRRRSELEAADRERAIQEASIRGTSKLIGKPDSELKASLSNPNAGSSVEELERELGIDTGEIKQNG